MDLIVREANRKLFIPHIYKFLVGKRVEIIGVYPFTSSLELSQEKDFVITPPEIKSKRGSALKIFLNTLSSVSTEEVDGFLIEGEKVLTFEETVLRLVDIAGTHLDKPVIYKLPDISDGDVGGTLRLIYQKSLLDNLCAAFLFTRNKQSFSTNKKTLLNLEIAVPRVRSVEEFLQIKREMASRGIARKGMLKIWMEVSVPENVINIERYIEAGMDGVILNLDSLQKLLIGFTPSEKEFYQQAVSVAESSAYNSEAVESSAYKKEMSALLTFIFPIFKILHKCRIPFIVKGELVTHQDVLDFLVKEGALGVVAENVLEAENLPEHIRWTERRIIIKITSNPSKLPN